MTSPTHGETAKRRYRSFLQKTALSLAATAVAILIVEFGLHAVGYWPEITWEWQLGNPGRVLNSDVIMIRPDLLDDEYYEMDRDDAKIIALGDSFTEGYPVSKDDSFPAVLDRLLREEGVAASVLNMGLGNSGPDIHLRLLQGYVLPRLEPDLLIWAFYTNDLDDNLSQSCFEARNGELIPLDGANHWTYRRSQLYDTIPLPDGLKRRSTIIRIFLKVWEAGHLSQLAYGVEAQAASRARVPLALREAKRLSEVHGFEILIVHIAPQVAYLNELDPATWSNDPVLQQYQDLRRILRNEGHVLEIFHVEALEAARREDPESSPPALGIFVDASRDGSIVGQHHFNEKGYRLTAEVIADYLGDWKKTAPRDGSGDAEPNQQSSNNSKSDLLIP